MYFTFMKLTFHLHDLIGVLDDFVLGLVAEGVGPGLDQVKDLILHVRFGLFLNTEESYSLSDGLKKQHLSSELRGCLTSTKKKHTRTTKY